MADTMFTSILRRFMALSDVIALAGFVDDEGEPVDWVGELEAYDAQVLLAQTQLTHRQVKEALGSKHGELLMEGETLELLSRDVGEFVFVAVARLPGFDTSLISPHIKRVVSAFVVEAQLSLAPEDPMRTAVWVETVKSGLRVVPTRYCVLGQGTLHDVTVIGRLETSEGETFQVWVEAEAHAVQLTREPTGLWRCELC